MSSVVRDPQEEQAMAMGLLSLVAVPRLKAGAEIDRPKMRREELVLIDLVDGKRTVAAILQEGRLSGFVAMRILRSLYLRNILEPSEAPEAGADTGAAAGAPAAGDRAPVLAAAPPPQGEAPADLTKKFGTEEPARSGSEPQPGGDKAKKLARTGRTIMLNTVDGRAAVPGRAGSAGAGGDAAVVPVGGRTPSGPLPTIAAKADKPDKPASADKPSNADDHDAEEPPVVPTVDFEPLDKPAGAAPTEKRDAGDAVSSRNLTPRPFQVGPYDVAARIAQGGMGSIYVCRRRGPWGFERLFTLKVVRQHAAVAEEAVRSFMREARLGAMLSHPNLLGVVDAGSFDGHPYLILDYVEGASLSELLTAGRPAPDVLVAILIDMLAGLGSLHAQVGRDGAPMSLVHGDVSPENVLVGVDGAARLGDFGSARAAGPVPDGAEAVAKPAFMAPEQLCGEPVDRRTDIFSVGVTMWTALTGQKLFSEPTYEQTVMNVMRKKVPPPSSLGAPAALDDVCVKALSRGPDGRFATADEMRMALLKAATPAGLVAPPSAVGAWVRQVVGDALDERRRRINRALAAEPVARPGLTPPPATVSPAQPSAASPTMTLEAAARPKRRVARPTIDLTAAAGLRVSPPRARDTRDTREGRDSEEMPVLAREGKWRLTGVVAVVIAAALGMLVWAAWRSSAPPAAVPSLPAPASRGP